MENPSGLDTISNILKKEIENAKIAAAKGLPEKAAIRAMNGAAEAARNEGRQRIALQINNGDLVAYLPDAMGKFNAIPSEHDLMQQLRSFLSDGVKTKPDYIYNSFTRSDVVSGRHAENMEWVSRMYILVGTPKQNGKPPGLGTKEELNTMKALGLLALVLAEWEGSFKRGGKPNASAIADAILEIAKDEKINVDIGGISKEALRKKIAASVNEVAELMPGNSL